MTVTRESVLERHPDAQWSLLGDELVVLDPAGQRLRGLNATAARLWELVDGLRSFGAIVDAIADEFDADRDRIEADAVAFVGLLGRCALVRIRGADAPASPRDGSGGR